MPANYSTAAKAARMNAVRSRCAGGTLEIRTAANAALVAFDLDETAGAVEDAVWIIGLDDAEAEAGAAGTAANAVVKAAGGAVEVSGLTVGMSGSGADVILSNTNIALDQPVELTGALTITHA